MRRRPCDHGDGRRQTRTSNPSSSANEKGLADVSGGPVTFIVIIATPVKALIATSLAACAQIEIVYAWKGRIEHGKEYCVLFKTTEEHYAAIKGAIRDLHSYELPAIHAVPFEHISAPYKVWIEGNTY